MVYNPKRQVCIYVVAEEGSNNVAKIGITELLSRRLGGMQSNNWRKLSIYEAFEVDDLEIAQTIESAILGLLSSHILRGEWMRVSPAYLSQIIHEHLIAIGVESRPTKNQDRG